MEIVTLLNNSGFHEIEGFCEQVPLQVEDLKRLTSAPNLRILEIGFNAGHSACVFLENETSVVTSFDLGIHGYIPIAKTYVDEKYTGRHTLFLGDSRVTIPTYIQTHPTETFDVLFVDGGHDYEIAREDLINCSKLARPDSIVIIDDVVTSPWLITSWTPGPTRAWAEQVDQGGIVEEGRKEYAHGRGMAWGRYTKSVR
jgi:predicted O-methyltransferase YrrM